MKYCHSLSMLLLLSSAAALQAEDYKHKDSGLQFTLPKGWKCAEKDGQIIIQNAEKTVHLVGGVIAKKDAAAIFGSIDKFLAKLDGWDNVKVTDGPKKEKVNGLEQAWFEGTASVKDEDGKSLKVEWDLTVVSGGKGLLFLVGMGQLDKNEKVYEKFFESIKKTKDDDD